MNAPEVSNEQLAAKESRVAAHIAAKISDLGFTEATAAATTAVRTIPARSQMQARVDSDSEAEPGDAEDSDSAMPPELEEQGQDDSDADMPELIPLRKVPAATVQDELPELAESDEMPGLEGPDHKLENSEGMPGREDEAYVHEASSAQSYPQRRQQQQRSGLPNRSSAPILKGLEASSVPARGQSPPTPTDPPRFDWAAFLSDNALSQHSNKKKKKKKKGKGKNKGKAVASRIVPNLALLPEKILERIIQHLQSACAPSRRPRNSEPAPFGPETDGPDGPSVSLDWITDPKLRAGVEFQRSCAALSLTCRSLRLAGQRPLLHTLSFRGLQPISDVARFARTVVKGNAKVCQLVKTIRYELSGGLHPNGAQLKHLVHDCTELETLELDLSPLGHDFISDSPNGSAINKQAVKDLTVVVDLLENFSFPEIIFRNYLLEQSAAVPDRPLRALIFDFATGADAVPFHLDRASRGRSGPQSARSVTLRNIVCYNDSEPSAPGQLRSKLAYTSNDPRLIALEREKVHAGELGSAQDTFTMLNKTSILILERCRLSLPVLHKLLDVPAASTITALHLHELVQSSIQGLQSAPKPKFPLDRLRNLKHLRLGAVGKGIIDGVPPRLESVTFTVANSHETHLWLSKAVRGKSGYSGMMRLPAKCVIKVCPRIVLHKQDGPENVGDIEVADSWRWIQKEVAALDATLAKLRRKCNPMSFARALEEGGRYFKSDIYRWLARRGEEELSKGAHRNYLWGHPAGLIDEDRFMMVPDSENEADGLLGQGTTASGTQEAVVSAGTGDDTKQAGIKETSQRRSSNVSGRNNAEDAKEESTQDTEHIVGDREEAPADPDAPWSWSDEE